jgi:branched-subunit amino acid ABC-type transport system permease component
VVNFAVGALAMIPAVVYAELRATGELVLPLIGIPRRIDLGDPLGFAPAALLALAVGLAVSAAAFYLVFRPLRTAPAVTSLVATVGLAIVLQALAIINFGDGTRRTPPILPNDVITLFGRPYPIDRVWLVGVVIIIGTAVALVYRRTKFGIATRAAFLNEKGAMLVGLDPNRLSLANWMLASLLGAAVGILGSSLGGVNPFNYSLYVVPALGAVLAARLTSIGVAVGVGIAIGMFEALAVHIVAQRQVPDFLLGGFSSLVPFVVIIAALVLRGRGLPGRATVLQSSHTAVPSPVPLRWWPLVLVPALALAVWPDSTIRFAMAQSTFVTALLLSVVVLTGFVGQVSLAQLAFAGFSAFMLSKLDEGLAFPLGPLVAIALTTVVGTLVSIPALRIRGALFAIVSFAAAVVFDEVLFRSPTFVGQGGLASVNEPRLAGIDLGINAGSEFPARRFTVALVVVTALCAFVVYTIRRGPLGRRLLAVRANERAAASVGVDVARTKVLAAAIASFLAAVAGVMFAYKAVDFTGAGLDAQKGLELVALVYLGGVGAISGAVIAGVLAPSGVFLQVVAGGGASVELFLATGLGLVLVAVRFPAGLSGVFPIVGRWFGAALRDADADDDHDVRVVGTFEPTVEHHATLGNGHFPIDLDEPSAAGDIEMWLEPVDDPPQQR